MQQTTTTGYQLSKFLSQLRIDYGPPEQLVRFLAEADMACRLRGVELEIGNFDELLRTNQSNAESWRPLIATFDHRNLDLGTKNSFCVLGRNVHGEVVVAHAARYFDWTKGETFFNEGQSLRLFYKNPKQMMCPGEEFVVSAPDSHKISGRVVYSGAAWVRPDFRGRKLSAIVPKVVKALAFTKFNPDFICSLMNQDVHTKGFAPRFDYPHVDWDVHWSNSVMGTHRFAIVWMTGNELQLALAEYLANSEATQIAVKRNG